jgi:hypothetical protein
MPFDRAFFATLEGRHLVLAYAGVILIQGGYAAWIAFNWFKIGNAQRTTD